MHISVALNTPQSCYKRNMITFNMKELQHGFGGLKEPFVGYRQNFEQSVNKSEGADVLSVTVLCTVLQRCTEDVSYYHFVPQEVIVWYPDPAYGCLKHNCTPSKLP